MSDCFIRVHLYFKMSYVMIHQHILFCTAAASCSVGFGCCSGALSKYCGNFV